ncbi:MAG: transglutaminase domain-containing protein [Lentisphaeraceae bacterium]|nr:transglutaminase domain-containing protein [Lentisphaeraceae bacterium]
MKTTEKQNLVMLLMRWWAIMVPTVFFSIETDSIHIFFLGLAIALVSFVHRKSLKVTLRSSIYAAVLCMIMITIFTSMVKVEDRFFMTPSEMGIPAALICGMVLCFFDERPSFTATILILCVFAMMMAGDINESHRIENLPLPASFGELAVLKVIYIVSIVLVIPPFYYLTNRSHNKITIFKSARFSLKLFKWAITLLAVVLTVMIFMPTQKAIIPMARNVENMLVRQLASYQRPARRKKAFEDNVNLRNSFLAQDEALNQVFVHVVTDKQPNYIRSRIYDVYESGTWKSVEVAQNIPIVQEEHEFTFTTFNFAGIESLPKESYEKVEVYYSSDFDVKTILHFGNTRYIEMTCDSLSRTDDGTVTGSGLDFSGGVTLYNSPSKERDVSFKAPVVSGENLERYLQIPEPDPLAEYDFEYEDKDRKDLKETLVEFFSSIRDESDSDEKTVEKIVQQFHENFEYKLGTSINRAYDPVISLLMNGAGHCELYASASVMLLRAYGIPARYVTGIYCVEKHPIANYYIGRAQDLHAWVEYYDRQKKSWQLMEPTPASSMPSGNSGMGYLASQWESVKHHWQKILANIVRGHVAESVMLFFQYVYELISWCFNTPLKALSFCLLFLCWYRRRRVIREKIQHSKEFKQIAGDFEKLHKRITRIKDFSIKPSMTLVEIYSLLEQKNTPEALTYVECLKEYEVLRYCEEQRSHAQVKELRHKI